MQRTDVLLTLAMLSATGCSQLRDYVDTFGDGGHEGGNTASVAARPSRLESPPGRSCGATIGVDQLLRAAAADVQSLDADDQPFQRYLTLAGRFNAGVCGAALDADRAALSELVNVLSLSPRVTRPVAIDADELTYRIDIRDYGWDRAVTVDEQTFGDGWDLVTGVSPFAVAYAGPDADALVEGTGTRVPLMSFAAFANTAVVGDVYYALLDVAETEAELLADLGIDVADAIASGDAVRGATTQSRISIRPRTVERFPMEVRSGALWRALEVAEPATDIFEDPLSTARDQAVTIFTLPNGFNGFAMFLGDGSRIEASDILLDTAQSDFRARVATSCLGCHAQGVLPFEEEVRDFVLENASSFEPSVVATVERFFPPQAQLDAIIAADADVFLAALGRAGVAPGQADPVAAAVLEFDRDLDASALAAETFVPLRVFRARRGQLPETLRQRSVDRDDFASLYLEAACALQSDGVNTPLGCAAL